MQTLSLAPYTIAAKEEQERNRDFSFPINNSIEYPGKIVFTALKEDYTTLGSILGSAAQTIVTSADPAQQELINEQFDKSDIDDLNAIDTSLQTTRGAKPVAQPFGKVSLFLPNSLQFTDGIEYANVSLGYRGAGIESAINRQEGLGGVMSALIEGTFNISSIRDMFNNVSEDAVANLTLIRTIGRLGEDVRGALESQAGVTLNPNTRSLLRGVTVRRFRFTFKLIPSSREESLAIKNIIKFFRSEMYPDDILVGPVAVGYRFPKKFDIKMYYGRNRVATGILPCFLENFDTNYNPSTMGMFSDGNFPEIDISMSFIEHRTLRKKDIEEGF